MTKDIGVATDAFEHAVTAVHPRVRYVVGRDARFLWIPLTWLPECLSDAFLAKSQFKVRMSP